jgi:hypothetical protein
MAEQRSSWWELAGGDDYDTIRAEKRKKLQYMKQFYLVMICIAPLIGGATMQMIRSYLQIYGQFLTDFNILLFILAASMKPTLLVLEKARRKLEGLQETISPSFPPSLYSEWEQLQKEVSQIRRIEGKVQKLLEQQSMKTTWIPTIAIKNKVINVILGIGMIPMKILKCMIRHIL